MLKSKLRKIYLEKRKELSEKEVDFFSQKIIEKFILQFNPIENQSIHCFLPIEKFNEINTNYLIQYCWERNIKIFIPKIIGDNLISIELNPNTILEKNSWGILEPVESRDSEIQHFDFVITPLLYCDNNGNRVGYGKGFYDTLFSQISYKSKKIGVSYFPPNESITDIYLRDIPLDYLITPDKVLSFSRPS